MLCENILTSQGVLDQINEEFSTNDYQPVQLHGSQKLM